MASKLVEAMKAKEEEPVQVVDDERDGPLSILDILSDDSPSATFETAPDDGEFLDEENAWPNSDGPTLGLSRDPDRVEEKEPEEEKELEEQELEEELEEKQEEEEEFGQESKEAEVSDSQLPSEVPVDTEALTQQIRQEIIADLKASGVIPPVATQVQQEPKPTASVAPEDWKPTFAIDIPEQALDMIISGERGAIKQAFQHMANGIAEITRHQIMEERDNSRATFVSGYINQSASNEKTVTDMNKFFYEDNFPQLKGFENYVVAEAQAYSAETGREQYTPLDLKEIGKRVLTKVQLPAGQSVVKTTPEGEEKGEEKVIPNPRRKKSQARPPATPSGGQGGSHPRTKQMGEQAALVADTFSD